MVSWLRVMHFLMSISQAGLERLGFYEYSAWLLLMITSTFVVNRTWEKLTWFLKLSARSTWMNETRSSLTPYTKELEKPRHKQNRGNYVTKCRTMLNCGLPVLFDCEIYYKEPVSEGYRKIWSYRFGNGIVPQM